MVLKIVSWSSLVLVVLVFVIAIMRYVFNRLNPMQELVLYLHAIFMFGASYTLADEGHVRVDIIYAN